MSFSWESWVSQWPPLNTDVRRSLDERGYVIFPGLVDRDWLDALRERFETLVAAEGDAAGSEVHQEAGTRRLANLVDKGEVFDRIYLHPTVLAAVYHVLARPFKLSSLNARDALPGEGAQPLHADWGPREANAPWAVVNSLWMLDDFTVANGATRLIPGSHLKAGTPKDYCDPEAPHPDQVLAIAPAGSVLVWNAHCWHGGTQNQTTGPRRALHCYYAAREFPQQTEQRKILSEATKSRLDEAAQYLLDIL
ncbi:MAG: phytanoyl-CoA dioxygenase family protein [Firmicutes bacterium]|nr:phytanoyl-CoA dioxygenase family protein [Bacillota bacterium]